MAGQRIGAVPSNMSTAPESLAIRRWFLSPQERGNPDTRIDSRRGDGLAWTLGNGVEPLIDGAAYFSRLLELFEKLDSQDWLHFTDWRGDCDELLNGPGTEVGKVLAALARRGVTVCGLVWRSHPAILHFSAEQNLDLSRDVNEAGGNVLLDQRVHRAGSHHQKLLLLRHPGRENEDVAFVGGIDLCHGRRDDHRHLGDPQSAGMGPRYGERPPWHDAQIELHGPAVGDLAWTFRERWDDPTPLDSGNPIRLLYARMAGQPRHPPPMPAMPADPDPTGSCAVQVLRTYPAKKPPFPFAREGERSIARAYVKAFSLARSFIYLEDQYFWSGSVTPYLGDALSSQPKLRLIVVVPRYPERDGPVTGPPSRIGQVDAMKGLMEAGGDRVQVFDLENRDGCPIYVHSKVCIIDDIWTIVGSDNMNVRSWSHDSELSCAVMDESLDGREPADPGGSGEGARCFARDLRLRLWSEHLELEDPAEVLDPVEGTQVWRSRAATLRSWYEKGASGPRPPGRVMEHGLRTLRPYERPLAALAYRLLVDPDGRPESLRKSRSW